MQFRDLGKQYKIIEDKIQIAIQDVLNSTSFISGKQVADLEKHLSEYVGVKHCISCGNGTDALLLVLTAWGIGEGDAVFVPDFTFFATAEVVSMVGATPVFVDVDTETFNIDQTDLKNQIDKIIAEGKLLPKVIIPVDLFGLPADYNSIDSIAKKYDLLVLEDGAQGFGSDYHGKKACSFGHAAITSFFPAKPLGCYGDGGAIFTNDDELANILKSLRVHGKGKNKYDNIRIGFNSRLDTIQAAILNIKFDAFISHELDDVNRIYRKYNMILKDYVKVPRIPEGYRSSFAQYTIKLKSISQRNELQNQLKTKGIPSMIYYVMGLHKQTAFKELGYCDDDFPNTNSLCNTVLSLPMHPYLNDNDIDYITGKVIEYLKQSK